MPNVSGCVRDMERTAGPQASEILVEPFVPAEPRRRIRELFARTRGDETVVESSTAERLE